MYNSSNDNIPVREYISKEEVLKRVSQERIFEHVFGYPPEEFVYVKSPFRNDTEAGAFFSYDESGVLRFVDFADGRVINGIRCQVTDCFNAIQLYYNLPNFYQALAKIKYLVITGQIERSAEGQQSIHSKRRAKGRSIIHIEPRPWILIDKEYWDPYGITKAQLESDQVIPSKRVRLINPSKEPDKIYNSFGRSYTFTAFEGGRKKVYNVDLSKDQPRFISTTTKDDIGDIKNLIPFGKSLIVSKSYKDNRVLRNCGINAVWLQNEGMIPNIILLKQLGYRFEDITVIFDNDEAGIAALPRVVDTINSIFPRKARGIYLPVRLSSQQISDPADLRKIRGEDELKSFLKHHNLII